MDVLIRDVDPHAVKKIDDWAKKKDMSRQAYLKELIEKATLLEMVSQADNSFEKQLQVNTLFLEKASDSMSDLVGVLKELLANDE
jgi:arsenate reductase-like glutaredoxin family protein